MIPFDVLNPLILSAYTKEMTWLEASARHSLDELIDTFYATRVKTHDALNDLTDEQVWFASKVHPFWTIGESITHLIYTQGFYHNKLLDISTSQMPHSLAEFLLILESSLPCPISKDNRRSSIQ